MRPSRFQGFIAPTTTDTPNDLFDVVLPRINNLAELKVVLYVIRRTFGFHKQMDWISLSQFEYGIVNGKGERLDDGIGMAHASIVAGLKRAVGNGYLIRVNRCPDCGAPVGMVRREQREAHASKSAVPARCPKCDNALRGREQVYYGLRWTPPEVVQDLNYPGSKVELGVVQELNTQKRTTSTTTRSIGMERNQNLEQVCACFAKAIGAEGYEPSEKEIRKVAALFADGMTLDAICTGITRAVEKAAQKGQRVRTLAYCIPEVRSPTSPSASRNTRILSPSRQDTETGTPETPTVKGQPRTDPLSNDRRLEELAEGDAELRDLLDVVQECSPARSLRKADVRAWKALAEEFRDLAERRQTTPIGVVMQAVIEALQSGSDRDGYLVPGLPKKILTRWRETVVQIPNTTMNQSPIHQEDNGETAEPIPTIREGRTDTQSVARELASFTTPSGTLTAAQVWTSVLDELKLQMTKATFDTLLRPTHVLEARNGEPLQLVIEASSPYNAAWLEHRLHMTIMRTVTGILGRHVEIRYVCPDKSGMLESA